VVTPGPESSASSVQRSVSAPTLIAAPAPGTVYPLELQPYVIEWHDRLFRDVGVFRSYLLGLGVDWSAFLDRHPAVVKNAGLLAVAWDGRQFYDQASLQGELRRKGISYRRWAQNHPLAAAILAGQPVQTTQRVLATQREKRVLITWGGVDFTSANGLRIYVARSGSDWNDFLGKHPTVATRLGLAAVEWGGKRYYTARSLELRLRATGSTLARWKREHPGFVEKLVP
jgi:hypothetical protein